jgi:F5/8 type C domain
MLKNKTHFIIIVIGIIVLFSNLLIVNLNHSFAVPQSVAPQPPSSSPPDDATVREHRVGGPLSGNTGPIDGGTLNPYPDGQPNPILCDKLTDIMIVGVTAKTSESSFPPQNAIDRSDTKSPDQKAHLVTKWVSTSTLKPWIKADLGLDYFGHFWPICGVQVTWGEGFSHQYRFIVSVSLDGTSFTKVFSGKSAGISESYSFAGTTARYVRIMVTESTPGDTNSIAQIGDMLVKGGKVQPS